MRPPRRTPVPWRPIDGLTDPHGLAVPELRAFTQLWQRQRARMQERDQLDTFEEQLARRWSIETGVIERLYDISRGATETLVKHGFIASLVAHGEATIDADELMEILGDHRGGLDMVMDVVAGNRPLSPGWIKELHALLTRTQSHAAGRTQDGRRTQIPLLRGEFKVRPNNPMRPDGQIHEYCPPEHVRSEIDRLLAMFAELPAELPEVRAAWLHHRFVQIHPFQDGNGRVARGLASFELVRGRLFPLVIERNERDTRYFPALEQADDGDLRSLVELTARSMIRSLRAALVPPTVADAGSSTRSLAVLARSKVRARRAAVDQRAAMTDRVRQLADVGRAQLDAAMATLTAEIPELQATLSHGENVPEMFQPLRALAVQDGYVLDLGEPYVVCSLILERTQIAEVALVLHSLASLSPGAGIANLMIGLRPQTLPRSAMTFTGVEGVEPLLLAIDEDSARQRDRLTRWLATMLERALDPWMDTL